MTRILGWAVVIVATAGAWTILASRLFVWSGGLSAYFPSPWTTWWRYVGHRDNTTLLYLIVSGVLAAVPFILAGIGYWRYRQVRGNALYGATGWANKTEMQRGGINTKRRPF